MKKQLLLTLLSISLITAYFSFPATRKWANTIFYYITDSKRQFHQMDRESRKRERFGNDYIYSCEIARFFAARPDRRQVEVLIPPSNYFTKMGIPYHVPEPAVFYYFTDLKTVWANNKSALNVNWYVRVVNGRIIIDSVIDRQQLRDTILAFQKLGITL